MKNKKFKLTIKDIASLFDAPESDILPIGKSILKNNDFSYKKILNDDKDNLLIDILKKIADDTLWVSGTDNQDIWQRGWMENFEDYKKSGDISLLTPKFIVPNRAMRLFYEYIIPTSGDFEFNVIDIYRRWLFSKYLPNVNNIFEFGCGSCQHLPILSELFPNKEIHGLDWVPVTKKIIDQIVKNTGLNLKGHVFDMYNPYDIAELNSDSGVFTFGAMEQLGNKFYPFTNYLLSKKPKIIINVETTIELYDENNLLDYLALKYDRKRNYLNGYLTFLKKLENDGRINILKSNKVCFGSQYHDPYSLTIWSVN